MKKRIELNQLADLLFDGMTLMIGGFLTNGTPENLVDAVVKSNVTGLTVIANDGGYLDKGVGKLIAANQVKRLIVSHIGTNKRVGELMQENALEVILVPQGTLIEKIRAQGAGLGGILTKTGLKTLAADSKQHIDVNGETYVLEPPLKADLALVGGAISDRYGNLVYRKTMRNFNPIIATAATKVVAEVNAILPYLDPEHIITPHPLVDYVVLCEGDN